jgi:hypothetical protein
LGTSWGPNGDQRVSLRIELGGEAGLLYVHDPTWDEYAVLGSDVPLTAVEDAFGRALRLGEQAAVEDFVRCSRTRWRFASLAARANECGERGTR